MNLELQNAQNIDVANATVEFLKGTIGDITTYKFSTVEGGHPMVNAMAGLAVLKEGEQLTMLNHCAPIGLFPKVENEFDYTYSDLPSGLTQVVFSKKAGANASTDFSSTSCSGGCG